MTLVCLSLCGLIGALWIATGSGAVAQRVLGSTVIGGMIAASAIAIFLIPVAFYAIEHLFSGWKSAREQEVAERPLGSAIALQRELASGVSR